MIKKYNFFPCMFIMGAYIVLLSSLILLQILDCMVLFYITGRTFNYSSLRLLSYQSNYLAIK